MADKKTNGSQPGDKTNQDTKSLAVRSANGLSSIFDDFFRPFDQLFQPFFDLGRFPGKGMAAFRQPILDIQDRGDHFSVTAELPGFTKDEVQIKVDSEGLELRAEKTENQTKGKDGAYQASSRSYYQYLTLPDQVVTEKIDGTMKNGILELRLPKRVSKPKESGRKVDLK